MNVLVDCNAMVLLVHPIWVFYIPYTCHSHWSGVHLTCIAASENYTKAKLDGRNSAVYMVYPEPNLNKTKPTMVHANCLVESDSSQTSLGFVARSFQGLNKEGLILFEHHNYCGNGKLYKDDDRDINSDFPSGKRDGVSSFIMYQGEWALFTWINYQGTQLGGMTFGPATYRPNIGAHDHIQSVRREQN